MYKLIALVLVAAAAMACKTGNPQQRQDIINTMSQVKQPLDDCYQIALARNRKTPGGFITVELVAEAGTGQFKNVLIRRDEVQDPAVRMCVITAVSQQKMSKPPDSNVTIPFAFRFTPRNP
jgi:hypothetical protein